MISSRIAVNQDNNESDVKTLQLALNVTLKVKNTVNGLYSRQTADLVRRYQENVGHLIDGVVTKDLWDMLIGEV
jgi:peptidoglycan hydrolase-like protein with peptidoglycan-binding domain